MGAQKKTSLRAARTETHAVIELCHGSHAIQAQLSVDELDQLIRTLAKVRADLKPEVPQDSPKVAAIVRPSISVKRDPLSGMIAICFRHPGLGWQGFALPDPLMQKLASHLDATCRQPAPSLGLAN